MEFVGVKQIGENTFQIIGVANEDNDIVKAILITMVSQFAEKAEKSRGIPLSDEIPRTIPTKIVVYATYRFMSGADIEAFLKECQNI